MRNKPRLITAEEMRDFDKRQSIHSMHPDLIQPWEPAKAEVPLDATVPWVPAEVDGQEVWVEDECERKLAARSRQLNGYFDTGPIDGCHVVPGDVLAEATINDCRMGIDLLALSKPAGSIMDPEHWLYDALRDNYADVMDGHDFREWKAIFQRGD